MGDVLKILFSLLRSVVKKETISNVLYKDRGWLRFRDTRFKTSDFPQGSFTTKRSPASASPCSRTTTASRPTPSTTRTSSPSSTSYRLYRPMCKLLAWLEPLKAQADKKGGTIRFLPAWRINFKMRPGSGI